MNVKSTIETTYRQLSHHRYPIELGLCIKLQSNLQYINVDIQIIRQ